MREETVLDENGKIVDLIVSRCKRPFCNGNTKREDCIGKFNSELFPDSMPIFYKIVIWRNKQKNLSTSSITILTMILFSK